MIENCGNCKYGIKAYPEEEDSHWYLCRKNAPVFCPENMQFLNLNNGFPSVKVDEWCGTYKEKDLPF